MKRNILARRAASAALAACMMFTLSAPALAASTDALLQQSTAAKSAVSVLDEENGMMEEEPAYQMNLKNGSIRVYIGADGKQYAKQGDNEAQQSGNLYITTDGGRTTNTLTIEGGTIGAKVTLSNVNINASGAAVSVSGNVELVIAGTNTLHSGTDHAGVEKADDNGTLTISGTGTLNAYGGESGAGIGSVKDVDVSNIVIESGTINAYGGSTGEGWGAGIGGGNNGDASNITINGGIILAVGGSEAAGIGGGIAADASGITITGGEVTAIGGGGAAAIGGGRAITSGGGKGENIQITGGNVTVKSGTGVWIGGTNGEITIDPSKLLGTITKLDKDGNQVDEIVQYFNIKINDKPVTRKNYEDILGNDILYYNIEEKTLKLKDGNFFEGSLTINAPADVSIDLEADASHVVNGDLTVNGAKDVKVTKPGGNAAAAIQGKAEISCSGDVILENWGGSRGDGRNLITNGLTVKADTVTTEGGISGETIIDCIGDIKLGNEHGTTVSKLKVNSANNVTVTSGSVNRSIGQDGAEITCSGIVELDSNRYSYENLGKVSFTQANGKPYVYIMAKTSVYKGYKRDKIEMRVDRVEVSDFPLYLNTVAGGLDRRDQTIGGFSFVVKIYAVPVVEIIGQLLYLLGRYGFNTQFGDCL